MTDKNNLVAIVNDALRIALKKENPEQSLDFFLEYLGTVLTGDRAYIFEKLATGNDSNTYEWCAKGIEPMKSTLQDIPPDICENWYKKFGDGKYILIKNIEDIKGSDPLQYEILKRQSIYSLIVVPLYDSNNVIGFYGIDNPLEENLGFAHDILQVMANFIVASIRRRDLIIRLRLEEQSKTAILLQQEVTQVVSQRTQENLDAINNIIGSGMWSMDFDEQGKMTNVYWSPKFCEMIGFAAKNDFPDTLDAWSERIHPDEKEDVMKAYWDCVEGKGRFDVKYRLMKKNGEYDWFHGAGLITRYPNGKPRFFTGTFINITEKIKSEQALEEAYHAANRANAAKTEFLASMSHDIRTPLNAIIGMTAIAEANITKTEKVQHCLSEINVASRHLLYLVNEILDMNKIESGKLSLNISAFNLSDAIKDFIALSKPLLKEKQHEFIVDVNGIKHENVIGDSERLQQCLMNFMSNAVKYTQPGGKIKFSLTEKNTNRPKIACYEFIFEDNGIGMSKEFIPSIFDPFARANDERVQKQQGTGLGLPITRNIIRMMNGDIKVESELNKGSKFIATVFLELQESDEEAASRETTGAALENYKDVDFSGKKVLLVEDNEMNSEIAKEILEMTGLSVDVAWDGKEAVEKLENAEDGYYKMVFMDIQMPVMNGYDATEAIRKSKRDYLKNVPIVAMSANAFAEDVQKAVSVGMNEHVSKPLDFNRLLSVITKWIL